MPWQRRQLRGGRQPEARRTTLRIPGQAAGRLRQAGRRQNRTRQQRDGRLRQPASIEDKRNVSAWFATQAIKPGAARNRETLELGQRIYRAGLPGKNVPACAGCHSPNGAGIPAQYPRLGGQWAEYTDTQLRAFRDGTRRNNLPMGQIAARMTDARCRPSPTTSRGCADGLISPPPGVLETHPGRRLTSQALAPEFVARAGHGRHRSRARCRAGQRGRSVSAQLRPKTSLNCCATRMNVVRFDSSFRRRAPT